MEAALRITPYPHGGSKLELNGVEIPEVTMFTLTHPAGEPARLTVTVLPTSVEVLDLLAVQITGEARPEENPMSLDYVEWAVAIALVCALALGAGVLLTDALLALARLL